MRNAPLLWPGWWDTAPALSCEQTSWYSWVIGFLNCNPRRRTCGECAFHISSAEAYWRCRCDREHRLLQGSLTRLPLLWLTTAAACFVCVDSAVNSGSKKKKPKLTNNANADHLFVSPFCSNYSSSARMTKYQHKVHSRCWLSSPNKRVSASRHIWTWRQNIWKID